MPRALAVCAGLAVVLTLGFFAWNLLQAESPARPPLEQAQTEVASKTEPEPKPVADTPEEPAVPTEPLHVTPTSGEIRGVVLDRAGEIAITNAKVTVELYTPRGERNYSLVHSFKKVLDVDARGRFKVDVPGGSWFRAIAEARGFAPATKEKLRPGSDVTLTMTLGAGLQGVVYALDTKQPLAGVKIKGKPESGGPEHKVETDKDGLFYLRDLPSGNFILEFLHADYVHLKGVEQQIASGSSHQMKVDLDPGKKIRGNVVTKRDKYPIADAVIKVGAKEVKSDDGGQFFMNGVPADNLNIEVTARGFKRHTRSLNLSGSRQDAKFEVELAEGAEIYGEITDEEGKPIAGARVKLYNSWGNGRYMYVDSRYRHLKVTTDEHGKYVLSGLSAEKWYTYAVGATHKEFPDSFAKNIKIQHTDEKLRVDVMIHGGGLIEGTVRDTDGNPVVGARVRLHSQSAWDWGEQRDKTLAGSDATGLFAFRGVSEGRYNLYVDAKGYSTAWQGNIQIIGSSERTGIEVTLHKGEELKGVVLNKEDGEPVPGVLVTVRSKGAQGKGVTGPKGNFTITSIPEGPYYVTTKLEGFATFSKRRMNAEADGMLHVEVSKQPYIKGVVIDDKTEKPVRRFQVMLTRKNERRPGNRWSAASRWISDKQGKFNLQAKVETYRLEVYAKGYVRYRKDSVKLELDKDPPEFTIRLRQGGAIEGYVRGPGGKPLRSIQIYEKSTDEHKGLYRRKGYTEHDGYFFIGDLDSGDHDLVARGGGYPFFVREGVRVGGAYPTMVEVDLERVTTLTLVARWKRKKDARNNSRSSFISTMDQWGNRVRRYYGRGRSRMKIIIEALEYQKIQLDRSGYGPRGSGYKVGTKRTVWMRNGRTSQIRDLRAGPYRLTVKAPGYPERIEYVRLDFSTNTRRTLEFKPPKKVAEKPAGATTR